MRGDKSRISGRRRGRGRGSCTSEQTGTRLAPLTERLRRMLERRVAEASGRGGRDLSDKDLSAAVVDISRLVTASARLGKLQQPKPERETGPESSDSVAERILGIMRAASRRHERAKGEARAVPGETLPRRNGVGRAGGPTPPPAARAARARRRPVSATSSDAP